MRVKIGDKIYNAGDQPIMVILNNGEIEQISNMTGTKYCQFPKGTEPDKIKKWMETP